MTEFTVSLRPRYGEVDSMGVVYHAHHLAYFDVGRTEYMRAHGLPYADLERRGFLLAVVEVGLQYRRPARYDEALTLAVWPAAVTRAGVRFEYELRDAAGAVLVTGFTRLGCLDRARWRAVPLPEDARAALGRGMRRVRSPSNPS